MSQSARGLPARPSLAQLKKQAKEKLHRLRDANPDATLADAQFALAGEYGFESWPRLVRHVETVLASGRIAPFEQLASDLLAGYGGDAGALERLGTHFGDSYSAEQLRIRVRDRIVDLTGAAREPDLPLVRLLVARMYGHESWATLADALARPAAPSPDPRLGSTAAPPFYRIDLPENTIEPRPPLTDHDWDTIFAVMTERRITGINASCMTDRAMDRLAQLDFVTRVNVGGARLLTDDGLLRLARMPQIEELDLSGWHSPITDRGLVVLRDLKNLKRFQMCWPQRVTDAGAANLSFCPRLERVDLLGTPTGDGAINALRGMRALRTLKTGKLVTDVGVPLLHDLPVFKTWQGGEMKYELMSFEAEPMLLLDGPFTDRGLAALAGLDGLFGLSFFWHSHAFTSDGLAALAGLPQLGYLGCQDDRCDDAAMRRIAAIPNLRMLMAQGTVATDDGFTALSRSRTIEYLWGRGCPNLTGRGFAALQAMPALRGLGVSCKGVDDAALALLSRFPALTELMPMDVPDAGFRHVGACERLERLWCMYCRDTGDAATEHLAGLARLRTYYAGKTRITDRSLEILSAVESLERLEFWQTAGITDAGITALARLPRLREISVDGAPRVSRAGMAVFRAGVRVNYA